MEGNGDRQEEQQRGGHSVEDVNVGVDAMVEGRLGEDEHAGVDELDDDGDRVSLLRPNLRIKSLLLHTVYMQDLYFYKFM